MVLRAIGGRDGIAGRAICRMVSECSNLAGGTARQWAATDRSWNASERCWAAPAAFGNGRCYRRAARPLALRVECAPGRPGPAVCAWVRYVRRGCGEWQCSPTQPAAHTHAAAHAPTPTPKTQTMGARRIERAGGCRAPRAVSPPKPIGTAHRAPHFARPSPRRSAAPAAAPARLRSCWCGAWPGSHVHT